MMLGRPQGFKDEVSIDGFPLVHFEWIPVCQTGSALVFNPFVHRPNRFGPEITTLLVNGIESPDDLSLLARRFPLRADIWQAMLNEDKPVAFNVMYTAGRVREPATITVIGAFANAFFSLFGTNELVESERGE